MATSPAAQMDLLGWTAPRPVARFKAERVRAASLLGRVARAVAETLKGASRKSVAELMSTHLGEPVTRNMLNAYASEAREGHVISLSRLVALIHATHDRRLLQVIADEFGWVVVDAKYLPTIELASLREHEDDVRRRRQRLQAVTRAMGAL